jgi:hypothetical protein
VVLMLTQGYTRVLLCTAGVAVQRVQLACCQSIACQALETPGHDTQQFATVPLKSSVVLWRLQVRAIGRLLGVPEAFIKRHPFPGPGMGVRILGDVTEGDRLEVSRHFCCDVCSLTAVPTLCCLSLGCWRCQASQRC